LIATILYSATASIAAFGPEIGPVSVPSVARKSSFFTLIPIQIDPEQDFPASASFPTDLIAHTG
jgi:hypothetical protein